MTAKLPAGVEHGYVARVAFQSIQTLGVALLVMCLGVGLTKPLPSASFEASNMEVDNGPAVYERDARWRDELAPFAFRGWKSRDGVEEAWNHYRHP